MSSYAKYCRDQAAECGRRARLASSPEVTVHCRQLELRWLRLAERARPIGRPQRDTGSSQMAARL
jgi:hypothetical protein